MAKLIPRQYAKILYDLTKEAKKTEYDIILKEYIRFLQKEQVLSKVKYIVQEFEKYSKEKEGITQLTIQSKNKLSKNIIDEVKKLFEGKIEVEEREDKEISGGLKVRAGNTILDATTNAQIERLKRSLI
jgi:F0F1-type ATP synthase delta subunit